jgi:hypothetical protein
MQFKPTYLYIKIHNKTGLKYFGKTISKYPEKYKGSGTYWKRHLKVYGNDVRTEIIGYFDDKIWCLFYATEFSYINDIVHNKEWANLKIEYLDGGWDHITKEHQQKAQETRESKTDEEKTLINMKKARPGELNGMFGTHRYGIEAPMFGKNHSEITKNNMSDSKIGRVVVIDNAGVFYSVSYEDPRIATGELCSGNKNKLIVKDKYGNTFQIKKEDPAYLSGELVSVNVGKKRTKIQKDLMSEKQKKLKWYNNGKDSIRCEVDPGSLWKSGRGNFKEKLPLIKNFNNGIENRRMRFPIDNTWVEGKISITRIWINNGIEEKPINIKKLYLYSNWKFGRLLFLE